MGRFASLSTRLTQFVWLLHLALQVACVVGRGPDALPSLQLYNFSMSDCSLFRNEAVLRPRFGVWPEAIAGVPFHYCCEYQPNGALSTFELSNYTYNTDGGTLQLGPYYDLGIVEKQEYAYYWRYWYFWGLPQKQFNTPMLYCEVTDLRRLHLHRYYRTVLVRGAVPWAVIAGVLVCFVSALLVLGLRFNKGIYRARAGTRLTAKPAPEPALDKEEAFADACHILLLAIVGSSMMEGIARSSLRTWRSVLMFNGGVTYVYLTLFATLSTVIRHGLCLELRTRTSPDVSWHWQKVFGQLVATFIVGMYLVLVDDVTEHGLDAFASLVLGTCAAASVWSAGVELVVMVRFGWQKIIRPNVKELFQLPGHV